MAFAVLLQVLTLQGCITRPRINFTSDEARLPLHQIDCAQGRFWTLGTVHWIIPKGHPIVASIDALGRRFDVVYLEVDPTDPMLVTKLNANTREFFPGWTPPPSREATLKKVATGADLLAHLSPPTAQALRDALVSDRVALESFRAAQTPLALATLRRWKRPLTHASGGQERK